MIEKLNHFLFTKVNSSYTQEELTILLNTLYFEHKSKKGHEIYLIEDNFETFANNFICNLTEEQKSDFEKLYNPEIGLFHALMESTNDLDQLVKKYQNTEEGVFFLFRFHIINEIQFELLTIVLGKDKLEVFKFSQTDVANEFQIDKKTLSKWLELVDLKEKYFGRKQLSFNEYNEIFRKLFLESEEDFDVKNKFQEYKIRLEEKKTLSKKDIIRLGFELIDNPKVADYERAQEIIQENKDFDFYHSMDKYPYAIAIKIINYLKSNS
jgi:hypothetical protein